MMAIFLIYCFAYKMPGCNYNFLESKLVSSDCCYLFNCSRHQDIHCIIKSCTEEPPRFLHLHSCNQRITRKNRLKQVIGFQNNWRLISNSQLVHWSTAYLILTTYLNCCPLVFCQATNWLTSHYSTFIFKDRKMHIMPFCPPTSSVIDWELIL